MDRKIKGQRLGYRDKGLGIKLLEPLFGFIEDILALGLTFP
jgi:hypothetical protein